MTIEMQNYLVNLYTTLKPDPEAKYLVIENDEIRHSTEKPDTKTRHIFRFVLEKLNALQSDHQCRSLACCDEHTASFELLEQYINIYYGDFTTKLERKTFSPIIRHFKKVVSTNDVYNNILGVINHRRVEIQEQRSRLESLRSDLNVIFDEQRVQNKELTIPELIDGAHLALHKALYDPEWREENQNLLKSILDILFDATDTAQLSEKQIESFLVPFERLEDFFGEQVIWTMIPITNKITGEMTEMQIPTLSFLAGPSNNLLSS